MRVGGVVLPPAAAVGSGPSCLRFNRRRVVRVHATLLVRYKKRHKVRVASALLACDYSLRQLIGKNYYLRQAGGYVLVFVGLSVSSL